MSAPILGISTFSLLSHFIRSLVLNLEILIDKTRLLGYCFDTIPELSTGMRLTDYSSYRCSS